MRSWKVLVGCFVAGALLGPVGTAWGSWWQSQPGLCAVDPAGSARVADGMVQSGSSASVETLCPILENQDHPRSSSTGITMRFYDGSASSTIQTVVLMRDPASTSFESIGATAPDGSSGGIGYVSTNLSLPTNWNNSSYNLWYGAVRIQLPAPTGSESRSSINQFDVYWP